jgi:hypothetical protein
MMTVSSALRTLLYSSDGLEIDPDEADMVAFTRDVHPCALRAVGYGFVAADIVSTIRPACGKFSLAPGFGHSGCITFKEVILG